MEQEVTVANLDETPKRLSAKEFAKKIRKEAYQKAKERRKNDPRQIAMKARQKAQRRTKSAKAKERRMASKPRPVTKAVDERTLAEKAIRDQELMAMIVTANQL